MGRMISIEVDEVIFKLLQEHGTPFVDSPNDVLRKLLLTESETLQPSSSTHLVTNTKVIKPSKGRGHHMDTYTFVRKVLEEDFVGRFGKVGRYRFMFENDDTRIYFQNYNQSDSNLWYRISETAWRTMNTPGKNGFIYFTNPAEGVAYCIPVKAIKSQMIAARWNRDYLEVNIDHLRKRWRELNWEIGQYLKKYDF